jgi:hypothetical protein
MVYRLEPALIQASLNLFNSLFYRNAQPPGRTNRRVTRPRLKSAYLRSVGYRGISVR